MIPARNQRDLEEIPEEVRGRLEFIWLDQVDQVIAAALEPAKSAAAAG
jgi:ATP-dependent Lon protease